MPEAWLRGPLEGIDPYLMPAAHALVQASEELQTVPAGLTVEQLWDRPGGAASVGFHLRHIPGSIDRLLTYARGEGLSEAQLRAHPLEGEPGDPAAGAEELIAGAVAGIERAMEVLRSTSRDRLLEPRRVGRLGLPSNVIGLLFHIAEHTQRHVGQVTTTTKVVREGARANP